MQLGLASAAGASTLVNWLASGVFLSLGLLGLLVWRRLWRGDTSERMSQGFSVLGDRQSRAVRATVPFNFVFLAFLGLLMGAGELKDSTGQPLPAIATWVYWIAAVGVALGLLFMATIFFFNRPRVLVPPYLRDSHGLLGDLVLDGARRAQRDRPD